MSDHDSADLDEMTVEDENRRNLETDDMQHILDNFMQSKEETLEELVGGLMYLTMEDVWSASNAATILASQPHVFSGENPQTLTIMKRVTAPEHNNININIQDVENGGEKSGPGNRNHTDDIEEEILEENTDIKESSVDALFRHRPASLTKFDNFMLSEDPGSDDESGMKKDKDGEEKQNGEEEEAEDDWMPTSGYMASFATGNAAQEERPQSTETAPCVSDGQTVNPDCSQVSIMSSQHTSHLHSANISVTESSHSNTMSGKLTEETVTISKGRESDCDSPSNVCDNDVEAPAWTLNPGEAEDEISALPAKPNVSVIEISTRVAASSDNANGEGSTTSQEAEKDSRDEVVPFELDEDYDYDNVVYTPKFTQAEMNYLASFLPHNS